MHKPNYLSFSVPKIDAKYSAIVSEIKQALLNVTKARL